MQPKAAKKIGGMTPKKMTGGAPFNFEGTDYEITKDITQDGKLTICVSTNLPTGEAPAAMVPGAEADAEAERIAKEEAERIAKEEAERKENDETGTEGVGQPGGKKKRKSSKKRKSMKKKGGMKRKSMKVKA